MNNRLLYVSGLFVAIGAVAVALVTGRGTDAFSATQAERHGTSLNFTNSPIVPVLALSVEDEILIERYFLGRLESNQSVNIGFDLAGRIETVVIREGDLVRAGDVIATLRTEQLDIDRQAVSARVNTLREQRAIAQNEEARLSRLVARGSVAANSLDRARGRALELTAALSAAETELRTLDLQLDSTTLVSPITGTVGAVNVTPFEAVVIGQPVVELFQSDATHLRVSFPAGFDTKRFHDPTVLIDNRRYPAELVSLRADINSGTNTRDAVFGVIGAENGSFGRGRVAKLVEI